MSGTKSILKKKLWNVRGLERTTKSVIKEIRKYELDILSREQFSREGYLSFYEYH